MSADVWAVLSDEQRLRWTFTPFAHVGPLTFGMTHEQVQAAVHGVLGVALSEGPASGDGWAAEFWLEQAAGEVPAGPAVTTYYDESNGLAGVAVNALRGPQVTLDGLWLVGQRPSRLERDFTEHLAAHSLELRYSQGADPCSPQLGLVLRVQRAGDVVLSRPVMVAKARTEGCWDVSEGCIPTREWTTFV
ncbi:MULTISPECIES: hypothetical protein [unclassified Micromonospora]|uniref:hypothetical protein n=1 Tax=unclassified Micromonospora TaxID=2617518 RepID=UPI002FF11ACE